MKWHKSDQQSIMKFRQHESTTTSKLQLHIIMWMCFSLAVALLLWFYATGGTVAYTMDSLTYRDAALNIRGGHSWMATNVNNAEPKYQPLAVWPPGYAALWAFTTFALNMGVDEVPSILVPALLGVTTACMFSIVLTVTSKPSIASIVSILNTATPTSMAVFGHAWSETLSLPLSLMSLAAMLKYFLSSTSANQMKWLATIAVLVALANWTRYSSAILLPLVSLTVLLMPRFSVVRRVSHACFFVVFCLACIMPLWLSNFRLYGSITGSDRGGAPRHVADRLVGDIHSIFEMLDVGFFSFDMVLRANVALPLLLLSLFLMVRTLRSSGWHVFLNPTVWIPLLWAFGFLSFLLLARSLQTQIDMDYRMLSAATPFFVLALTSPLQAAIHISPHNRLKGVWAILVFGLMINTGFSEAQRVHNNRAQGKAPNWRAKFFMAYRDLSASSRSSRAIKTAVVGVPINTLLLTDYRGLYIRYLTGIQTFQVNNLAECVQWVSSNKTGILLTGYSDHEFSKLPETRWARACGTVNPDWKIIQVTGPGSHSMIANE